MKKVFLLALAALCVSAAQAVTFTWSNSNATATSWGGNYTFSAGLTFSFLTDATISSNLPTSGNVALTQILIAQRQNATMPATVKLFDGETLIATATSVTSQNGYVTTLSNNDFYTRSAYNIIFDSVVDVTKSYTFKFYDSEDTEIGIGVSVVRNEADNAWLPSMTITAESLPVPEPTALALLALGVAGLVLRRKVA